MLTQARLKEVLHYDPETGAFTRKISYCRWKAGEAVGACHGKLGYVVIGVDKNRCYAHRLAWFYMTGVWPRSYVDHIDGNPANNAWPNLREATASQNLANARRPKHNTSGHKGVGFHQNRWRAYIKVQQRIVHLGTFATVGEARAAYATAAEKYFGEFARVS